MKKKQDNIIRVTVYISEPAHRKLKSKLALENLNVSEWVRQQIDKKIK